jgi:hypothetical protein
MRKIDKLTPEQEALIPVYREKWRQIALSTEPIDHQKAVEAVKEAYVMLGQPEPEIVFFDSPHAAWKNLLSQIIILPKKERWDRIQEIQSLTTNFETNILYELRYELTPQIKDELLIFLLKELDIEPLLGSGLELMWSVLDSQSTRKLKTSEQFLADSGICNLWAKHGAYLDFCISVLNCVSEKSKWLVYQNVIKNIGKLFPMKERAVLCERPCKLLFDTENRLHAEAEPAVQFVDGYSVYVYHGTRISEKYGKLHRNQW